MPVFQRKTMRKFLTRRQHHNFKSILLIAVITLSCFAVLNGCIKREEVDIFAENSDGEVTMTISNGSTQSFVSDSAWVMVDYAGSPGLWILSISAFELPIPLNIFAFTATGIAFPGSVNIDSSTAFGAASYTTSDGILYRSQLPGGFGVIEVYEFIEQERIAGSFNFTLIDTITGDILTIENGSFDAAIDESLYLNH